MRFLCFEAFRFWILGGAEFSDCSACRFEFSLFEFGFEEAEHFEIVQLADLSLWRFEFLDVEILSFWVLDFRRRSVLRLFSLQA